MNGNRRRIHLVFAVVAASIGAAAFVMVAAAAPPEKKAGKKTEFKPVQSTALLMQGQKKLYGEIKDAILDGNLTAGSTSAWILAELANVNHYQRDDSKYQTFAGDMKAHCEQLAKAMRKNDKDESGKLLKTVGQTCGACHNEFQKKS